MAEIERFGLTRSEAFSDGGEHFPETWDIERVADGEYVRHSDHLADKAAELEDLAGEFEGLASNVPGRDSWAEAAARLRERAAELRATTEGGAQ